MRRVALVCVVVLVVGAVPAGVAGAVADGPSVERVAGSDVAPEEVAVTTTFSLADTGPDEIRVTKEYRVGSRVRAVSKAFGHPLEVVSTRNVDRRGDTFEWDGTGDTVRIEYVASAAALGRPGAETVRGDGYAVVGASYGGFGTDAARVTTAVSVDGEGTAGETFAVLGGYTEHTRDTATRQYRVVVPDHVSFEGNASAVLDAVAYTDARVDAGAERSGPATYFVVSLDFGYQVAGRYFGAYETDATGDVLLNTWSEATAAHEAVHQLKQAYATDRSADWTTEATATYYGHLQTWQRGHFDFETFAGLLSSPSTERSARLAEPDTWAGRSTPYDRGSRVVAYLDREIRAATDGERTFEDVLRRMNEHDGTVTNADLTDIVVDVAGPELEPVVERYATTDAVPPAPSNPYVYADPDIESRISLAPAGPNGSVQQLPGKYQRWRVTLTNTGPDPSLAVGFDAALPAGWNLTGVAVAQKGARYMKSDPVPGAEVGYFRVPAHNSTDFTLFVRAPENRTAGEYDYELSARDFSGRSTTLAGTVRVDRETDDTEGTTDGSESESGSASESVREGAPPSSALTATVAAADSIGTASVGNRTVPVLRRDVGANVTVTLANASYPVHSYQFGPLGSVPAYSVDGSFTYTPRTRGPKTIAVTANLENGREVEAEYHVLVNDPPSVEIETESGGAGSTVALRADVDDEYGNPEVVWLVDGERAGTGSDYLLERREAETNVTVVVRDGYGGSARDSRTVRGMSPVDRLAAASGRIPGEYALLGAVGLLVAVVLVRRRSG